MSFYFIGPNLITCTRLMNIVMQYAQDIVSMSHSSQYIDADHAVLGQHVAGADDVADVPLCGLY